MVEEREFLKYAESGAYHWEENSKNILKMNSYVRARYQIVLDALADVNTEKNTRVLDVGCGDGALSGAISERFRCDVTGVDTNELAVEYARRMFEKRGYRGAFLRIEGYESGFNDSSFDVVICADVIEHVARPDLMLAEMRRVLRPGGLLVVSTPLRLSEKPLSSSHVQEWFAEEFTGIVQSVFPEKALRVTSHPLFWYEILQQRYERAGLWRAPFMLMNLLDILGFNIFLGGGRWKFYMMQTLIINKSSIDNP